MLVSSRGWRGVFVTRAASPRSNAPCRRRECPRMPPQISEGATGAAVRETQYLLNRIIAVPLPIDGTFGPTTKTAVEQYQQMFGLTVTGVVGPETWQSMLAVVPIPPTLAPGSHGGVVRR